MPELPDVEVFRRYFGSTSLHKKIKHTRVMEGKVLQLSRQKLQSKLHEQEFTGTDRHGKYLFARIGDGHWLVLHFGMTGFLKYFKDESRITPHARLLITFTNGYHLAYDNQRLLGKVDLAEDVESYVEAKKLGPDALNLGYDEFKEQLEGRKAAIKPTLMNQEVIAGIGNIYSDEILFQAGMNPKKRVNKFKGEELKTIYSKMQAVLSRTIDFGANPDKAPSNYLLNHRSEGDSCPRCGGKVKKISISGRSGYYCPQCQR
jgi:formamidopyrimidine-DNA glycosylase